MKASIRIAKRLIDVVGSATGILCGGPVMGAIAIAIKATSPGPVLYRQRRAGRLSEDKSVDEMDEFFVYKFRTMVPDAEVKTGAVLSTDGDPRITPVGRFLRKTRLDELPQFFNVFKGEMSIVGPRPERPELIRNLALAIPFFDERMREIKPGITGLAQIHLSYRGRLPGDLIQHLPEGRRTVTVPALVGLLHHADRGLQLRALQAVSKGFEHLLGEDRQGCRTVE